MKTKIEFSGKRLQTTARAAGIDFEEVVFWKNGRYPKRVVTGILVAEEDADAMRDALNARDSRRRTPAQKAAARLARQRRDAGALKDSILAQFPSMPEDEADECARHATEIGSRRIGRSTVAENPARAAVVAFVRHNRTSYDTLLNTGIERDEARRLVGSQISEILEKWKLSTQ